MNLSFGQKKFKPHFKHHSQTLRIIAYGLCNECNMQNYAMILHI
jgi:hypothetical protein